MSLAMSQSGPDNRDERYLVVGDSDLARRVCSQLQSEGQQVTHLTSPTDDELSKYSWSRLDGVAVLVHDDVAALRYALAISHINPLVPIVATIFDRTIGSTLSELLSAVTVTSPSAVAAPGLAAACLDSELLALIPRGSGERRVVERQPTGLRVAEAPPVRRRTRIALNLRVSPWRALDRSARKLAIGTIGLIAILLTDTIWLTIQRGGNLRRSVYDAVNVLATVGPTTDSHGARYEVFSSVSILLTIGLLATFTAGLVERISGRRLVAFCGPRAVPRRNHVIVVGLGQVGLRLCVILREFGIPVVAVERDPEAVGVRLAMTYRIPVIIGHAGDRELLKFLNLNSARAVAAVGSDDLDNIAIAVAAHGVSAGTHVVLRAGEQEAVAETKSLLKLGMTVDVMSVSTAVVTLTLLTGQSPLVVNHEGETFASFDAVAFAPFLSRASLRCSL